MKNAQLKNTANLDPQMYVPLNKLRKRLSKAGCNQTVDEIREAAKLSSQVRLNDDETMVRPLIEPKRTTLMIRDVPQSITRQDLKALVAEGLTAVLEAPITTKMLAQWVYAIRLEYNQVWFVLFREPGICQKMGFQLMNKEAPWGGKIRCGIKSEYLVRSFMPAQHANFSPIFGATEQAAIGSSPLTPGLRASSGGPGALRSPVQGGGRRGMTSSPGGEPVSSATSAANEEIETEPQECGTRTEVDEDGNIIVVGGEDVGDDAEDRDDEERKEGSATKPGIFDGIKSAQDEAGGANLPQQQQQMATVGQQQPQMLPDGSFGIPASNPPCAVLPRIITILLFKTMTLFLVL